MILATSPRPGEASVRARAYALRGSHVLPIEPGGKKPLTSHGCHDATTDHATIERWYAQTPTANVGIACGRESGIWVLDIDGPDGETALAEWSRAHGDLPPTYTVATPSGGRHLYFVWPDDRVVGNRTKIAGVPIDARGTGGYVVAPPSIGQSGIAYVVVHDAPIAEAPIWLLDLVAPIDPPSTPAPISSAPPPSGPLAGRAEMERRIRAYLTACPPAVSGSGGHNTTFTLACALVHGFGLSAAEAMPYFAEWSQRCEPPWSKKDLHHKLADAETKGSPPPGRHRGYLIDEPVGVISMTPTGRRSSAAPTSRPTRLSPIHPWRPLPIDAIPDIVRQLVIDGAASIGVDPAYLAVPALAILAGCIGNARRIAAKRDWIEPSPLWSAVVAESGAGKSPALDLVAAPVRAIEKRRLEEHQSSMREHEERLAEYRQSTRRRRSGVERDAPPTAPKIERLLLADTTVEAMARMLRDSPRGVLVVRGELSGWLGSMDRYAARGGGDISAWITTHDVELVTVDRVGDGSIIIPRACVSLTGTIQPGVLARHLTPAVRESGLAARVLWAMPPRSPLRWSDAEIAERSLADYQRLIEGLLALDMGEGGLPKPLSLADDARSHFARWINDWGDQQAEMTGDVAASWAKTPKQAIRIALVHHVCERVAAGLDDRVSVGVESIRAGITLAEWFASEAERVYTVLAESAEERELRPLVELIARKGGSISGRDLQRANGKRYPTADAAQSALRRLADAGLGRLSVETPPTGGHAHHVLTLTDVRQTTLDPDAEDADPPALSDTRSPEATNPRRNEASVGPVGRRTGDVDTMTPDPPPIADEASVGQDSEDRKVIEL